MKMNPLSLALGLVSILHRILPVSTLSSDESDSHRLVSCALASGKLDCLHGGTCITGPSAWQGSSSSSETETSHEFCDCTNAVQINHLNHLVQYVGKSCEIPATITDYCNWGEGSIFCVNGGTCRVNATDLEGHPCQCPDGFTGKKCEYNSHHSTDNCSFTCSGKGACHFGVREGEEVEFCACDPGFAGTHCELEATDDCEGNLQSPVGKMNPMYSMVKEEFPFCVNNAPCVMDPSENLYFCECGPFFTGKHCESVVHPPTRAPSSTYAPTIYRTDELDPTITPTLYPTTQIERGTFSPTTVDGTPLDNAFWEGMVGGSKKSKEKSNGSGIIAGRGGKPRLMLRDWERAFFTRVYLQLSFLVIATIDTTVAFDQSIDYYTNRYSNSASWIHDQRPNSIHGIDQHDSMSLMDLN